MKIGQPTIETLRRVLNGDGDNRLAPYMSCPPLMDFFNEFGFHDTYSWGGGAPSRWFYAEGRLSELNGTDRMRACIEAIVDPRRFMGTGLEVTPAVDFLNEFLAYDGWRLVRHGRSCVLRPHQDVDVEFRLPEAATAGQMADFIRQQVEKCQAKLAADDHDGTITNARSLAEVVLRDLEDKLSGAPQEYDGNLPRLYKRVQKAMRLDPADYQEMTHVQQLLRGLTTIVDGLSGMSNELADRHAWATLPPAAPRPPRSQRTRSAHSSLTAIADSGADHERAGKSSFPARKFRELRSPTRAGVRTLCRG